MTPVRCLAYTLSQVGVCTTVPGVRSLEELDEILSYRNATAAEKDCSEIIKGFREYETGVCVYCSYCLLCPSGIDVGRATRLLDVAKAPLTADRKAECGQLEIKASECTKCRACTTRCPFDVDVVSNMERAVELFE
jgi:predicted aldo/keto reductase-like oxidoreductase